MNLAIRKPFSVLRGVLIALIVGVFILGTMCLLFPACTATVILQIEHFIKKGSMTSTTSRIRQLSLSLQQHAIDAKVSGEGPFYPKSLNDLVPTYLQSRDFDVLTRDLRISYHPPTADVASTYVLFTAIEGQSNVVYSLLVDGRIYCNDLVVCPTRYK